jgi:hypothetical protein
MKNSLLSILIISLAFGQSENATMTIYKNGYALIKQPVDWSIKSSLEEVEYSMLPEGIKESSPYLNLQSGQVINQKLDGNLFSGSILINESLGDYVTITTIDDEDEYGTLIAISPDGYTIQTRRDVIFLKKEQVKKVSLRKVVENPKFRPSLRWKISSNNYNVAGDLVYMSRGFDWDAVYRMVVPDYGPATLITEAYISNNSSINFNDLKLKLVEGLVGKQIKPQFRGNRKFSSAAMAADPNIQVADESSLGDYHVFDFPDRLDFGKNEHITVRLYVPKLIDYSKSYVFKNAERSQKEEPLEIELQVKNTVDNNLNIPLPQGRIELYQSTEGSLEFTGEDQVKQTPKGETVTITSGRSFDVIGKRKVLNFERQRKSEEASIEVLITNTRDEKITVRLEEQIRGDWVIKEASDNYIKRDASTINFPFSLNAGETKTITYTYRKEWN